MFGGTLTDKPNIQTYVRQRCWVRSAGRLVKSTNFMTHELSDDSDDSNGEEEKLPSISKPNGFVDSIITIPEEPRHGDIAPITQNCTNITNPGAAGSHALNEKETVNFASVGTQDRKVPQPLNVQEACEFWRLMYEGKRGTTFSRSSLQQVWERYQVDNVVPFDHMILIFLEMACASVDQKILDEIKQNLNLTLQHLAKQVHTRTLTRDVFQQLFRRVSFTIDIVNGRLVLVPAFGPDS
jgi:hypothetical protein